MELSAEKYPPEQVMRAQRYQREHHDTDIRAAAGYFVSERRTADGIHIITRPSLAALLDRLEEPRPEPAILSPMSELSYQDSIHVDCDPETLYDLVSDVTRMGEWSPICAACWWDDDGGPRVGAWFTGRNQTPERTWETRSQVVAADRGREFAFEVNHGWVRWGYTFTPDGQGTELTETWNFRPRGLAGFRERYGPDAEAQIAERTSAAHRGIPLTLAAIKKAAESS